MLGSLHDKLQLTGRALGHIFNFRSGCMDTMHLLPSIAIQPNLELKTQPIQLLGSLPLVIPLPILSLWILLVKAFNSYLVVEFSRGLKRAPKTTLERTMAAVTQDPFYKTYLFIICRFLKLARVFVLCKYLQPSLMLWVRPKLT